MQLINLIYSEIIITKVLIIKCLMLN